MTSRTPPLGRRGVTIIGLVLLVAMLGLAANEVDATRSHADEKFTLAGVPNFGKVTDHLFRGGQPTKTGFESLRDFGVQSVISFTLPTAETEAEGRLVRSLGLEYLNLPW